MIFGKEAIERLKGQSLQDQVDAFVQAGATPYKRKGDTGKVAQKKEAIQKAIDGLQNGLWTLKTGLCEANDTVHPDVIDEESEREYLVDC